MKKSKSNKTLTDILKNPSAIMAIIKDPGRGGLDLYNSLDTKTKQYVIFAAAAGLAIYGFTLNKHKR